jgi:hypothetical protein
LDKDICRETGVPVMPSDVEGAIDYAEAALLRDESPLG